MIGKMDINYEIINQEISKIILDLKGPEIVSVEYIQKDEEGISYIYRSFIHFIH